jgi:hypothetical protein
MKLKPIPQSVLNLLALRWRATGGYSTFDSNFNDTDADADPHSAEIDPTLNLTPDSQLAGFDPTLNSR